MNGNGRSECFSMLCIFLSLFHLVSAQQYISPDNIQSLLDTLPDLFSDNSTSSVLIEDTIAAHTPTISSDLFSDISETSNVSPITKIPSDINVKRENLNGTSSDFDLVEYHIRRYLNHRFSPCSDFFRFTCNYDEIGNNSLSRLSEDFYHRIFLSAQPLDNTQIDIDLQNVQSESKNSTVFSSLEYSITLTERCASNQSCYADEFKMTYQVYNFLRLNSTLLLRGFNESLSDIASSDKLEDLTTQLHTSIDSITNLETALLFYEGVRARMRVMERLERRKDDLGLILAKTRELAIEMAQGLFDKFNRTPWMHVKNLFNLPTFVQFSTILQNMTLRTDLDDGFDLNSTAQSNLIDKYLSYYNHSSENDLGNSLYTLKFSLLYATSQMSIQLRREGRKELLFRLSHSLQFVTGNVDEGIVLNAPSFFPLSINVRPESFMGSLGTSMGRELVYRFVNPKYTQRSKEYANEYEGISEHFQASCSTFGEKNWNCSGLRYQMQEYVADLEGLSLSYELLRRSMDYDNLHKQPYSDLPFTSEQLFFIAYSATFCKDSQQLSAQRINSFVRVNGALSQMPEFGQAFGCAKNDPMTLK